MGNTFSCASFFSGVGGIDLGFALTGRCETIYANEYDRKAAETFDANNLVKTDCRDIHEVQAHDVPDVDIILAGFPCQAFSIDGKRQGFHDEKGRGVLFFEVARIIEEKKPRVVFLENVKNLVTHDKGNTFLVITNTLKELGYTVSYQVLNASRYGNIPQNRERVYIVCFRDREDASRFVFPEPIPLTVTVPDIIDYHTKVDDKYYYTPGRYKSDIYEKLVDAIDDDTAVYQSRRNYIRKNKTGVIPTLTAAQGGGGHNVSIVKTDYGIRKMTPRECFRAQGFPDDFVLPDTVSESRLYKQSGNSVCVPVITRIAENVVNALEGVTPHTHTPQESILG